MTPEQSDGWKEIKVPEEETFVIAWRNKVYVATSGWVYDRGRPEDAAAIAQLDEYLQNQAAGPVTAAVMKVQRMTIMQAVD
jgi:hypothetical protein